MFQRRAVMSLGLLLLFGARAASATECADEELDLCSETDFTDGAMSLKVSAHRLALLFAFAVPGLSGNHLAWVPLFGLLPAIKPGLMEMTFGDVKNFYKIHKQVEGTIVASNGIVTKDMVEAAHRSSFEGALSHFVATNNHSSEDSGFAIEGLTAVRFVNEDIIANISSMAMGNYFFTNPEVE